MSSSAGGNSPSSPPSSPQSRDQVEVTASDGTILVVRLNWIDRIMRVLLSSYEWNARMVEKKEKVKAAYEKKKRSQR